MQRCVRLPFFRIFILLKLTNTMSSSSNCTFERCSSDNLPKYCFSLFSKFSSTKSLSSSYWPFASFRNITCERNPKLNSLSRKFGSTNVPRLLDDCLGWTRLCWNPAQIGREPGTTKVYSWRCHINWCRSEWRHRRIGAISVRFLACPPMGPAPCPSNSNDSSTTSEWGYIAVSAHMFAVSGGC